MAENTNFLRTLIDGDLESGKHSQVVTRFPPEPNGYLHIGHAKSICLNFGLARDYAGTCHLRFDDTNPLAEDTEFVDAIKKDVRWLGFDWGENLFHASDYFDQFYAYAQHLIRNGHAYVCSQNEEQMRACRGTISEPGTPSPDRDRPAEESLSLLEQMKNGAFPDGAYTLRARIDMASANMKMRDPALYRIRNVSHHHVGDGWAIYPMYDFAHCIGDSIEGITHSICTLEFENNRELYDWILDHLPVPQPQPRQHEFARLSLEYTMMSKRKLRALVEQGIVAGWDDPRMPTVAAMRRRGIRPEAVRAFAERVGIAKANSLVAYSLFSFHIRDDLNQVAPRVMAVLNPLPLVIENYPEGGAEWLDASYWPHDVPRDGTRKIPFSRELYIERDDFSPEPPPGFKRMAPGRLIRLRHAYFVTCTGYDTDEDGTVTAVRCTYAPESRGASKLDGKKPKATIHWVSAAESLPCEVRLYDHLFTEVQPDGFALEEVVNTGSLTIQHGRVEPSVAADPADLRYQFERQGYFWRDPEDSTAEALVFNRIIALRDGYAPKKVVRRAETPKAGSNKSRTKKSRQEIRETLRARDPMLATRLERYLDDLGLAEDDAEALTTNREVGDLFEAALAVHDDAKLVANWVKQEVLRELKDRPVTDLPFDGAALGQLVKLVAKGQITHASGRVVFGVMIAHGGSPHAIVAERGLRQLSSEDDLRPIVDAVVADNPDEATRFATNPRLLGFFVGQVMKRTRGQADAVVARRLLEQALNR